jgi:large subunit ribosomal protein L9
MAHIEILLRENVQHLGKCGDVVRVRTGYARNYLYPNNLATLATDENKRLMARKRARLDVEEEKRNAEIEARVNALSGTTVEVAMKADDGGHLFGSVNAATVVERLARVGRVIAEKDVRLDAPIKTVGLHGVRVHIHGERFAEITVNVTKEA